MEPEGSLPCLQKSDIPTLSQINSVQAIVSCSLVIHFNIIIPSKARSSKWYLSFGFLRKENCN